MKHMEAHPLLHWKCNDIASKILHRNNTKSILWKECIWGLLDVLLLFILEYSMV